MGSSVEVAIEGVGLGVKVLGERAGSGLAVFCAARAERVMGHLLPPVRAVYPPTSSLGRW